VSEAFYSPFFRKFIGTGRGREGMNGMLVELTCPQHGLERFTIKVVKRFNIPPDEILPKFRTKPKPDLSCILVGRNVDEKEVKVYLENYLHEKGLLEQVLSFRSI
jgi:hypothetical protein